MLNNKIELNPKVVKNNSSIPELKMKAIKYLALANITLLGFKTTRDIALLQQLNLFKDNTITLLKADILYECGVPVWQFLLFLALATPAIIINEKDKSKKKNKK